MLSSDFDSLLIQADELAQSGDWQACFDVLSQAAALDSAQAGVMSGQGTCLIQLGRPQEALPFFQKAVILAPDSAEACNNLGVAYALCGCAEDAETAYLEATRLDQTNQQAWKNLAITYLQNGRFSEGVQILAAVIQSYPQDVEALFVLARCYEQGDDPASARFLYEEILKNEPTHAAAIQGLVRLGVTVPDPTRIARPEHLAQLAKLKSLKGLK